MCNKRKKIKIIEAERTDSDHKYDRGLLLLDNNTSFVEIACGKDLLRLIVLQPGSKRIMTTHEYLFGFANKNKNTIATQMPVYSTFLQLKIF
jgi:methionyl-tRNA formyltransferase